MNGERKQDEVRKTMLSEQLLRAHRGKFAHLYITFVS